MSLALTMIRVEMKGLALLLLCCACATTLMVARCHGKELESLIIETNSDWNIGLSFRNLYACATKDQALAKLERLRHSGGAVSVYAFLGDKLRKVSLISFYETSATGAVGLVREVLNSAIIEPANSHGPGQGPAMWSELTTIRARALLEYESGRVGILETDGTHLFFEDSDGTCWWQRWDSAFPRRDIETVRQPDGREKPAPAAPSVTHPPPTAASSNR